MRQDPQDRQLEYRVRWLDLGEDHDQWMTPQELGTNATLTAYRAAQPELV